MGSLPGPGSTLNRDVTGGVCWLLTNVVMLWFACRLSWAACRFERNRRFCLATPIILGIAMIVGTETLLGVYHMLEPPLLLTVVALCGAVGVWRLGARENQADAAPRWVARARLSARSMHGGYAGTFIRTAWAVAFGCCVAHIVTNGLGRFPEEFDGLAYHLALVDHWLQSKSLYAAEAAWWWQPGTAELVGMWMVAPFSGDFLVALGNLPFIALWALSALDVARLIGLEVAWRHLAVPCWPSIPPSTRPKRR